MLVIQLAGNKGYFKVGPVEAAPNAYEIMDCLQCDDIVSDAIHISNILDKYFQEHYMSDHDVKQVADTRLSAQKLSCRAIQCLRSANIKTVYDLQRVTPGDLMKIRNLGKKTFAEIAKFMDGYGLHFGHESLKVSKNEFGRYDWQLRTKEI